MVFNGNGATGGNTANQIMIYDEAANLRGNGFSVSAHHVFDGWALSPGGGAVYSDGQSVMNLTTRDGGIVNLYAKWWERPYSVDMKWTNTYKNSADWIVPDIHEWVGPRHNYGAHNWWAYYNRDTRYMQVTGGLHAPGGRTVTMYWKYSGEQDSSYRYLDSVTSSDGDLTLQGYTDR